MHTQGQAYRPSTGIEGSFDAIVIGSGMGSLSAASILAQQGKRLLILEQHNVVGGLTQSYERAGYRWTVGLHYIGNVTSKRTATWKLFDYVTKGGVQWAPMPDIYNRMVIGDREYPIPAGLEPYRRALKDRFPDEHDAIDRYLELVLRVDGLSRPYFAEKALPPGVSGAVPERPDDRFRDFSDRVTIEVLSALTQSAELIALWCANWGDYAIEPSRSSFAMHCMLVKHYLNGGAYPVGGGRAFADAMVPVITSAGGQVFHSAEVAQILVENDKARGVRLASGEEVLCPVVISGGGLRNTYGRLLDQDMAKAVELPQKLDQLTDSYAIVGLNIGLEGSAASLGLDPANIWAHPGNDFEANLTRHRDDFAATFAWTFVTFPSAKDPNWDAEFPDRSAIEMYACTDYRHFASWAGTRWMKRGDDYVAMKAEIEKRLLDELYRLVPQARGAVRYVEVSTPVSYETFLKRQKGDFMGIENTPERFQQAWLRAQSPVEGLFLTGQDLSSNGVIGALMGGVISASAVMGRDMLAEVLRAPAFADQDTDEKDSRS